MPKHPHEADTDFKKPRFVKAQALESASVVRDEGDMASWDRAGAANLLHRVNGLVHVL